MFDRFSEKFQNALRSLRGLNKISESNITEALREVRDAFLEADVSFEVIKSFLETVRAEAIGQKVVQSIAPGQQLIKLIHDALLKLFGDDVEIDRTTPLTVMLVGLHGSGKTTSAVKLANYLRLKSHRPLVVACDIYRPAAIDQLEQLAQAAGLPCYADRACKKVQQIARGGLKFAAENDYDAVIFDTAGRLQIDGDLIAEIRDMKSILRPKETLLVADSALGQEAVSVANAFHEAVDLSGIILTKLDGDARGGAALSMKYSTGVPIKFIGTGEHMNEFDVFHAEGMVNRILGMGDVVALVERAHDRLDRREADRLAKKVKKSNFDFNDFLSQMEQIEKMGSMSSLVKLLPGMGNASISPKELALMKQTKAIIRAMTEEERQRPSLIGGNRKLRIARGSGVQVRDVNHVLKQFETMQKSMKMLKKPKGKKLMQSMNAQNAIDQLSKIFGPK